mgnify:CR=1 FL=1
MWAAAAALQTGATKSLGDNWGKIAISVVNGSNTGVDCSRVNMMGIEDPYGWQWEFLQGVFCGSSNNSAQSGTEIFIYKGNRLPTTAELAAHPNGEYRQATRQTASGQVQEIILGEHFDIFPKKIGGNSHFLLLIIHGQTLLAAGSLGRFCESRCDLRPRLCVLESRLVELVCASRSRLAYFGNLIIC